MKVSPAEARCRECGERTTSRLRVCRPCRDQFRAEDRWCVAHGTTNGVCMACDEDRRDRERSDDS